MKDTPFDALLADINLPDMLVAMHRPSARAQIKVIFASGDLVVMEDVYDFAWLVPSPYTVDQI